MTLQRPDDHTREAAQPFEWLAIIGLLGYALREPFVGAVQFYLSQINLGVLWFIPDAIALVCVVAILAIDIMKFGSLRFLFILTAIAYYMFLGYISIGSFASSLSGFKAMLPLFVGLLLTRHALQRSFVQTILFVLLILAMIGLVWSTFNELPWMALSFDSGLGVKQFKSTIWAYGGGYRPFGFASDPHSAGLSIVFLFALVGVSNRRFRFYMLAAPVGFTVYLSTSRTSLLAFAILMMFWIIFDGLEKRKNPRLTEVLTATVPFAIVLVPLAVIGFSQLYSVNEIAPQLLSVWVRGNEVFLQPVTLMPLFAPNAWLFGFGLGGVGFPVSQSAYSSYAAIIDNFLLFGYYSFGVPFLIFYFLMCLKNLTEADFYKRILFCVTIVFGQFILAWPSGLFMLVFGYATSAAFLRGRLFAAPSPARVHA